MWLTARARNSRFPRLVLALGLIAMYLTWFVVEPIGDWLRFVCNKITGRVACQWCRKGTKRKDRISMRMQCVKDANEPRGLVLPSDPRASNVELKVCEKCYQQHMVKKNSNCPK